MKLLPRAALLAAALVLAACGGGDEAPDGGGAAVTATGPADAQVVTVTSNDRLEFEPATVEAKVGTLTLTHRNGGAIPHNLVFDDDLGGTETLTEGKEEAITLTFDEPGTYDFVCTIHSGQDGKVVVS